MRRRGVAGGERLPHHALPSGERSSGGERSSRSVLPSLASSSPSLSSSSSLAAEVAAQKALRGASSATATDGGYACRGLALCIEAGGGAGRAASKKKEKSDQKKKNGAAAAAGEEILDAFELRRLFVSSEALKRLWDVLIELARTVAVAGTQRQRRSRPRSSAAVTTLAPTR